MSISDRLDEKTEQAARVIGSVMSRWDMDGRPDVDGGIDTLIARALAEAGVLATEPRIEAAGREWIAFPSDQIREEWGAEMDHPILDSPPSTIKARDLEHARWQVENNPKVATGRIMHRYVTDWEEA